MLALLRDCTSESMHPSLIFQNCSTVCAPFYHLLPCCFLLFALQKLISTVRITLLSPSLRRTSAPIKFAIVLGVLGTQEIACIWLQGHLRDITFILHLSWIDKP